MAHRAIDLPTVIPYSFDVFYLFASGAPHAAIIGVKREAGARDCPSPMPALPPQR
jgi:hypothetical protein